MLHELVVQARVVVLPVEFLMAQTVRIDLELRLGHMPILPPADSIEEVMDYRDARNLIVDLCYWLAKITLAWRTR